MQRNRPTLVDVARAAGVSRSTASRALNDQPGVAPNVRERVRRAVAHLDYHPDSSARALVSGRIDVIDLVVADDYGDAFSTNPFYGRVTAGLLAALAGTDAKMRIHVTPRRGTGTVLDEVAASGSIGTVLVNVGAGPAERFHERYSRVVSMGRYADRVPFSTTDNEAGATLAVRHLIEGGRRTIAAIGGPGWNPCAVARRTGYLKTVETAGIRPMWTHGDFRRQGGYDGAARLLALHPDIDAIFAACDLTAAGALQALADAGRRVPDDVAVVGFDDSVLATCASPSLTSVRQPIEEMVARATRDLLAGRVDDDWRESHEVSLSVRTSSLGRAA